jgi:hypothetical protein
VRREYVVRGREGKGEGEGPGVGGGGMCVFNLEHIKGALPYTPSGKVRLAERAEACSHMQAGAPWTIQTPKQNVVI